MNTRPTLKDVGAAAGVSVYVASRALRGESGVAASTRARVERAASELGYVRNEMAAGLRKKNSHTVGILTASGRNQYYSMLAQVIDSTLREYGYYAVVSDMLKDRAGMGESEEQSLRLLFEQRPAAIVATYALSKSALKIIESFHVPVVFVDSPSAVAGEWPLSEATIARREKSPAITWGVWGTRILRRSLIRLPGLPARLVSQVFVKPPNVAELM